MSPRCGCHRIWRSTYRDRATGRSGFGHDRMDRHPGAAQSAEHAEAAVLQGELGDPQHDGGQPGVELGSAAGAVESRDAVA